jgi:HK97 gp10 family phage protein
MADLLRVRLEGVDELKKVLAQLPASVRKKHLRRAVRQGIALIRDDIKNTAPIRAKVAGEKARARPGRLRRLVRIKQRRPKRGYLKASLFYPTEGNPSDPKNASHWRYVEFGTKNHAPNPYIARAVLRQFPRVIKKVIGETNRGAREELAKLRTKTG